MKTILLCTALLISALVYSQETELGGSQLTLSTTTDVCAVYNTGGDLYLDAFGGGGEPGGIIKIEDAGRVGVHTQFPGTPLHLRQLSGNSDGSKGFRIESADGAHHWTIEIHDIDNSLSFYYDGAYQAGIETNGDYSNPTSVAPKRQQSNLTDLKQLKTSDTGIHKDKNVLAISRLEAQIIHQQDLVDKMNTRIERLEKLLKSDKNEKPGLSKNNSALWH